MSSELLSVSFRSGSLLGGQETLGESHNKLIGLSSIGADRTGDLVIEEDIVQGKRKEQQPPTQLLLQGLQKKELSMSTFQIDRMKVYLTNMIIDVLI